MVRNFGGPVENESLGRPVAPRRQGKKHTDAESSRLIFRGNPVDKRTIAFRTPHIS